MRTNAGRYAALIALWLAACGGEVGGGAADAAAGDGGRPTRVDVDAGDAGAQDETVDAATDDAATAAPSPVCSVDGFCWELPSPQGARLNAAWAASASDVWAVGEAGIVLHWDGAVFRGEAPLTEQELLAVHGSGPADVWAVGRGGTILHYDGSAWSAQDVSELIDASGGAMTGVLHGVFAAAPDAVWAVGHSGASAIAIRYDGETWQNESSSLQTDRVLRAVHGVSSDRIWAVGDGGVIRAYDGATWSGPRNPATADLTSVHGLAEDDVWAVGRGGTAVHWDGAGWRALGNGLSGDLHAVRVNFAVAAAEYADPGTTADASVTDAEASVSDAAVSMVAPPPAGPWSVYAFGERGRVFRWNGELWAALSSGSELDFLGAARLDRDHMLAVGELGQMVRFVGDAREALSQGTGRNRLALWGDGATLWAVGDEIVQRTASGWSTMERPTQRSLYGVWGDADGLWAVGTAGTIVRGQQASLGVIDVPAAGNTWLRGVWGAGSSVWIVGHGGLSLLSAAGGFLEVPTPVSSDLLDVWGRADDDFWAVGEDGVVLRWNGDVWLQFSAAATGGSKQSLHAVWGRAEDDVWIVGSESTILHWDGDTFDDQSRGANYTLNDVWGAQQELYAVGTNGSALHFDGTDWRELETGTHSSLEAVWGTQDGRVFAAGLDGVILVLRHSSEH